MLAKPLYWLCLPCLILIEVGLWNSDYWVPLSPLSALSGNDEGDGTVRLIYNSRRVVDDVLQYCVLEGSIVGEANRGFFVVNAGGTARLFASRDEWLRYIAGIYPASAVQLKTPSRLRDPVWRWMASGTTLLLVVWLGGGLWVHRRRRVRGPMPS